jgi:hypothetical protein
VETVVCVLNQLIEPDIPEIFQKCNDYFAATHFLTNLMSQIPYTSDLDVLLVRFGTHIRPQAAVAMWHRSHAIVFRELFGQYDQGMIEFTLPLFDKDDGQLFDLLVSTARFAMKARLDVARIVINFVVENVPIAGHQEPLLGLLDEMGHKFASQIYTFCLANMTRLANTVPVVSHFLVKDETLITPALVDVVIGAVLDDAPHLLPLLGAIFASPRARLSSAQVAELIALRAGDELWTVFHSIVKRRGVSVFNADVSALLCSLPSSSSAVYQRFVSAFVRESNVASGKIVSGGIVAFPIDHLTLLASAFADPYAHLPAPVSVAAVAGYVGHLADQSSLQRHALDALADFVVSYEDGLDVASMGVLRHKLMCPPNCDLPHQVGYRLAMSLVLSTSTPASVFRT